MIWAFWKSCQKSPLGKPGSQIWLALSSDKLESGHRMMLFPRYPLSLMHSQLLLLLLLSSHSGGRRKLFGLWSATHFQIFTRPSFFKREKATQTNISTKPTAAAAPLRAQQCQPPTQIEGKNSIVCQRRPKNKQWPLQLQRSWKYIVNTAHCARWRLLWKRPAKNLATEWTQTKLFLSSNSSMPAHHRKEAPSQERKLGKNHPKKCHWRLISGAGLKQPRTKEDKHVSLFQKLLK